MMGGWHTTRRFQKTKIGSAEAYEKEEDELETRKLCTKCITLLLSQSKKKPNTSFLVSFKVKGKSKQTGRVVAQTCSPI